MQQKNRHNIAIMSSSIAQIKWVLSRIEEGKKIKNQIKSLHLPPTTTKQKSRRPPNRNQIVVKSDGENPRQQNKEFSLDMMDHIYPVWIFNPMTKTWNIDLFRGITDLFC